MASAYPIPKDTVGSSSTLHDDAPWVRYQLDVVVRESDYTVLHFVYRH